MCWAPLINIGFFVGSLFRRLFSNGCLPGDFERTTARRNQASYKNAVLMVFEEVEDAAVSIEATRSQQCALVAQRNAVANTLHHAGNR